MKFSNCINEYHHIIYDFFTIIKKSTVHNDLEKINLDKDEDFQNFRKKMMVISNV